MGCLKALIYYCARHCLKHKMSQLSLSSPWEVQRSEALQIVDVTEHHTFVFPFSSNLTHCAFAEVQKFAQQQLVLGARCKGL